MESRSSGESRSSYYGGGYGRKTNYGESRSSGESRSNYYNGGYTISQPAVQIDRKTELQQRLAFLEQELKNAQAERDLEDQIAKKEEEINAVRSGRSR